MKQRSFVLAIACLFCLTSCLLRQVKYNLDPTFQAGASKLLVKARSSLLNLNYNIPEETYKITEPGSGEEFEIKSKMTWNFNHLMKDRSKIKVHGSSLIDEISLDSERNHKLEKVKVIIQDKRYDGRNVITATIQVSIEETFEGGETFNIFRLAFPLQLEVIDQNGMIGELTIGKGDYFTSSNRAETDSLNFGWPNDYVPYPIDIIMQHKRLKIYAGEGSERNYYTFADNEKMIAYMEMRESTVNFKRNGEILYKRGMDEILKNEITSAFIMADTFVHQLLSHYPQKIKVTEDN